MLHLPQVLAVNILGRFLLNNDRNIRSVFLPPHIPVSLSLYILPLLSLGVILPFPLHKANGKLIAAGERNLPTGCYHQSELTNHFPWSRSSRAPPEGHCLAVNADLSISGHVIFHQAVWRPVTGSLGFCYATIS